MSDQNNRRRGWIIGSVVIAVLLVGGGISLATFPMWGGQNAGSNVEAKIESEANTPARTDEGHASPVAKDVKFTASPSDQAKEINPATPPEVRAKNGTIASVKLVPASGGEPVKGKLSKDGHVWTASERLEFDTTYKFSYTATDTADRKTTSSSTFTTVVPANEANAWTYPADGATVGVGQPIQINFSEPVLNKEKVEDRISITTSAGQQGAFHWYNDEMLRYRPKNFWDANSTITIEMKLFGVEFGNGMIGNHDSTVKVNIGDKRVAVADSKSKQMKVYINDELVRTMPLTMGMEEWPSMSGYHVVLGDQRKAEFRAESIGLQPGDEHYYEPLTVEYATRISQSGEFLHGALDGTAKYLGNTNISHGCIGLFHEDAAWMFNNFTVGDVVHIKNTGNHALPPLDGFGDWNMSWEKWTQE
ncbi:L,D-transpeptidase [Arthrobacter castelli]|uniref:L,D-transpeptidase n=1 Tax=Arthrobacter castelli TaxID=271431 RepID=UPI0004022BC5|nr:Ig-like domain-containing protein [Arthrobacter castelli]